MAIYRIADLSSVWVIADVYEQDLARVRVGQPATVRVEAFPDRIFDAKVTYLYPTLNVATRTTPVRLELDNRDGLLRPGMFSHVELADGGAQPRLTVPRSALIDTGERQVVLRVAGEGRFTPQPVRVGQRGRDHIEILEGIADGDEVVVAANFLIDAESNLKAALSAFAAPEQAKPAAKTYEAVGSIDALDAASNSVSMNHEPIPALQWPAMTMDFGLDSADVAKGLLPGEPLRFTFEDRGDGEFVIIKMDKADPAAAAHKGH
jgi:Cu(I)/Ag(I) efflux system membrane fusion protein